MIVRMSVEKVAIVWFRKDLRLHDHPALCRALSASRCIVPVYVFDATDYESGTDKQSRMGPYRDQFLRESVNDLQQALRAKGADLLVFYGNAPEILADLCTRYDASAIYYSREYAPEEQKGEQLLAWQVAAAGVQLIACDNGSLIDRRHLPFPISRLPLMFTEFRKAVEPILHYSQPLPVPEVISVPDNLEVAEWPALPALLSVSDPRAVLPFRGGERAALSRLDYYLKSGCAASYFDTRNGMVGGDYSTKFSVWLANGSLSPRRIYADIKAYEAAHGANKSTYWIIFELLWRDFFRFSMERYGVLYFLPGGIQQKEMSLKQDKELFLSWCRAETPDAFVNAHMRELNATGFMSNRGRQVVASYLVNDLRVSWLWGADYFERMLIDYDVYSNYGNWAYIAGVGNDPRPQRYFSPRKQAERYDPEYVYRRLWKA